MKKNPKTPPIFQVYTKKIQHPHLLEKLRP